MKLLLGAFKLIKKMMQTKSRRSASKEMARIHEDLDPAYAAACSDVTLCYSNKGFFRGFSEEIVSLAEANNWLKTYDGLEDDRKIVAVTENKEIMEALTEVFSRIQPVYRGKDARVSQERRLAAESALKEGDYTKALSLVSQAILRAPMTSADEVIDGGVSLALALWLRSKVLLNTGKYQAALEDLKLALKERLPARMRAQYYRRMGHCYKGAGEPTRAKVSYELATRLLGSDEAAKCELAKDIESLDYTVLPKHPPDKLGISLTGGAKQSMPALSKLIKIAEEEHRGRFAVANSAIKTGDVLLVDSPYAACLLPDFYGSHCLHCFKRLEDIETEAPVWCPKCSGVAFCSIDCRDKAVSTYHTYECKFLDLLIGSGMSILSQIALRMVTQAGLDTSLLIHSKFLSNEMKTVEGTVLNDIEGLSKKSKMKSRKERLNRSKKGMKSFTDKDAKDGVPAETNQVESKMSYNEKLEITAAQIYSLCTHSTQRRGSDYLKRVVMAMFLTECLKKAGFFKNCEDISKAESCVCELMLRNLQLLQFNAHEIYETLRGQHMFKGSKPNYIAVGIYPAGALFNHECYPAVARYFEGRKIVLRAIRPLEPDEIISENYGPHFMTRNLKERQRSLACRYWFRCDCIACKEDWPTLKQMKSDVPYLRCPNLSCTGKLKANLKNPPANCRKCSVAIDKELLKVYLDTVDRCLSGYQDGGQLMDEERPLDATASLCNAIDLFQEVARAPHRDTHVAQESLRSCYAAFGNVHVVKNTQERL